MQNQLPSKNWYESDTIRNGIKAIITGSVPVIIMLFNLIGVELDAVTVEEVVAFLLSAVSLVFMGGAIRGRFKAETIINPVGGTRPPPSSPPANDQSGQITFEFAATLIVAVIAALLTMFIVAAQAEAADKIKTATYTIEPPTERADGSPLRLSEIQYYVIDWYGPDDTKGSFRSKTATGKWTPPSPGEYKVTVRVVDVEDLASGPTDPVTYVAELLPPPVDTGTAGPAAVQGGTEVVLQPAVIILPAPPKSIVLSLPIDGDMRNSDQITTAWAATDYMDLTPSTDGMQWKVDELDGRAVLRAPMKAEVSQDQYTTNARVDYLVNTVGGPHTLTITARAEDGFSDSLWIGQNGKMWSDTNGGKPVFFSDFKNWTTQNIPVTLPEGQTVITLFMREKNLAVSDLQLQPVR